MPESMSGTIANVAVMKPTPALSATTDIPIADPPAAPVADPPAPAPEPDAAAAVETPDATGEPSGEPHAPTKPPVRDKGSFGERLSDLTRARNAAEERANKAVEAATTLSERLERALAALEARQQPTQTPLPVETPRPKRSDFADPDAYDDAYADWVEQRASARSVEAATRAAEQKAREVRETEEKTRNETSQRQAAEQIFNTYQQRRAEFIKDHPEFPEVAERDDVSVTAAMAAAITRSEHGPAIALYLGNNPDEAARIAALPDPASQFLEMGVVAAKVAAPARPQPSRAPRPIVPINSAAAARQKERSEMTTDEYAEVRLPELLADRRVGILPQRK